VSDSPRWDHKLPKSILSDYDLRCIAHGISSALHYTTGVPHCGPSRHGLCAMCGNAMRLVVQSAEPRILERAIQRMAGALGAHNIDLHPRSTDDTAA
jgi:hypothetical protein